MKWLDRLFGGPKDMAALAAGTKAPDFSLPALFSGKDGGKFSFARALSNKGRSSLPSSRFPVRPANTRSPTSSACTERTATRKSRIVGISQDNQRIPPLF